MTMIRRTHEIEKINRLLRRHPIVGIVGARQVGKTTLARELIAASGKPAAYFDLEDPRDLARLSDPMLALKDLKELVVIDEVQRMPGLFPVLRVLADTPRPKRRFLILGSASPSLLRQGSETLAGRIYYYQLDGFGLSEVGSLHFIQLWLRGGFPRSYLARTHAESEEWRRGFIRTFLERDLPQLGITIQSTALARFWRMLAHYHGQVWNSSEFGRSFGVSDTTVRDYLDLMSGGLVVQQLPPWHENISKRQVRAPKVYIADSGLLHTLLGLRTFRDVEGHPKMGASWEGFVIQQIVRHIGAHVEECFFWATYAGAELDLLIVRGNERIGFEIKHTSSPTITPSIRNALEDLKLKRLDVIHAGDSTFMLAPKVRAVSFSRILEDVPRLK